MKIIMYHYVRNYNKNQKYFHFIDKKKFIKQINKYSNKIVNSEKQILNTANKILLTFDDGLKDHYFVAKELKRRNLTGIFFIPSLPYKNGKVLNVHLVHLILGKIGGKVANDELNKFIKKNKITNLVDPFKKKKFNSRYIKQKDHDESKKFKKILNYYGNEKYKAKILTYLKRKFRIKSKFSDVYLTKRQIIKMSKMGMIIGSHSSSHKVLSNLSYNDQLHEIKSSKKFIESLIKKKCFHFCFPYGRKNSYNKNTLKILSNLGFKYGYSVESRNATKKDILKVKYEIPRYDANEFN